MQRSLSPYSPSRRAEQEMSFFWSPKTAATTCAAAAPGAYHADVPRSFVRVAPPTIVSAATAASFSAEINSEAGIPRYAAKRVRGIIVVSP